MSATASRLRLKEPSGWFAAGRSIQLALSLLSDSSFKLFVWMCLHADRHTGSICADVGRMARELSKTEREIQANLQELLDKNICSKTESVVEIVDRFWPYERVARPKKGHELTNYIGHVKRLFLARRCVRSIFTPADEQIAVQLYHNGIAIVEVEHAILLGSLRKYAASIQHGPTTPITSLRYFTALFDEVRQEVSPQYWHYLTQKLSSLERQWHGFTTGEETK
jgi:hypothetical protein